MSCRTCRTDNARRQGMVRKAEEWQCCSQMRRRARERRTAGFARVWECSECAVAVARSDDRLRRPRRTVERYPWANMIGRHTMGAMVMGCWSMP